MRLPAFARRHPVLRWTAPLAVLGLAVAAAVVIGPRSSPPDLRPRTVAELLAALRDGPEVAGYSGVLVAQLSLDLPASAGGQRASGGLPILLLAGAHTMRYWYGGAARQRVALVTADRELDVFRIGSQVWQWNSATNVATRSTLRGAGAAPAGSPLFPAPLTYAALTPRLLAARTAAAVDPGTRAAVAPGEPVAGRRTYRLSLEPGPRTPTRIAAVRIDVDVHTLVPLRVRVYARGQHDPSIDVAFSRISYTPPGAGYFRFAPPPRAVVNVGVRPRVVSAVSPGASLAPEFAPARTGWSAITTFRESVHLAPAVDTLAVTPLRPVSGTWGHGELLETPLLCVLVTDDGRVLSGSVDPAALYAASAD